jgi:GT2 family glycosyltransferase
MKILIAVPTFENITPDTFRSIYNLERGGHECIFEFVRGYDCATARNRIAQMSLDKGVDYVLMVDNDVTLPKDVLISMLNDAKDVCLGYYAHRNADNLYTGRVSVCRLADHEGNEFFNYPLESEYTAEEMNNMRSEGIFKVRIHGGGMGCALIKADVFRRISYPWYDWVNYADAHRGMLSEDLFFCEQCKREDIPIYTDTRAGCGHLLRHIQMPV